MGLGPDIKSLGNYAHFGTVKTFYALPSGNSMCKYKIDVTALFYPFLVDFAQLFPSREATAA